MGVDESLKSLADNFDVPLNIESIISIKSGHINKTYRIKNSLPNQPDVLLQKVNQNVFGKVQHLMNNLVLVTRHIRSQEKYRDLVARIIPTKQGDYWLESEGDIWRMHTFIKNKKVYDVPHSVEICWKAGLTYGTFLKAVDEIPVSTIQTHIPDFHNIRFRLHQLDYAKKASGEDRLAKAESVLSQIEVYRKEMCSLYDDANSGGLPVRVLHNDTKLSNVLIGQSDVGTVIDLDTIMPGFVFFDTGDALRSMAINAKEDEPDLDSITLNTDFYDAFVEGYLSVAGDLLTDREINSIGQSGAYMAYIMAVRFAADYLNGDVYYSTSYPNHNLVRASNQLKVCSLFSTR